MKQITLVLIVCRLLKLITVLVFNRSGSDTEYSIREIGGRNHNPAQTPTLIFQTLNPLTKSISR